jgi:2'-5' RNA ligase
MTEAVPSQTVQAYWLLPAPPAREFLRETIGRLARECGAPVFEPHLTLAIGSDSAAEAHRSLTGITSGPIELHVTGIHFEAKFTRTLFIRFDSSPDLERLRNSLGLERRDDQPFDPHVSLLYMAMTAEKQSQLAAAVKLPFETARFGAVEVVRSRLPVTTSADVTGWEVVASRRLED